MHVVYLTHKNYQMNSRSKKYYATKNNDNGDKKGSSTNAGYNEQNEKTIKAPKENPAPSKSAEAHDDNDAPATQDDTGDGGMHVTGKRVDDL
jgi:hypothetical protein